MLPVSVIQVTFVRLHFCVGG